MVIYEGAPSKVIAMRVATNVESYNGGHSQDVYKRQG